MKNAEKFFKKIALERGHHGGVPLLRALALATSGKGVKNAENFKKRFPSNEDMTEAYPPPLRNRYFTIGSSSVKTAGDRHRLTAYHKKHC